MENSTTRSLFISPQWIGSSELELSGDLASEWDRFRRALHSSGIILTENDDELQWIGGCFRGYYLKKCLLGHVRHSKPVDGFRLAKELLEVGLTVED